MALLSRNGLSRGNVQELAEALITGGDAEIDAYLQGVTGEQRAYIQTFDPLTSSATAVNISQDVARFARVYPRASITINGLTVGVGTAAGDIEVGVFTYDGSTMTPVETATAAMAGTNVRQRIALSDSVTLAPDDGMTWYFGVRLDGTTGTLLRVNVSGLLLDVSGADGRTLAKSSTTSFADPIASPVAGGAWVWIMGNFV